MTPEKSAIYVVTTVDAKPFGACMHALRRYVPTERGLVEDSEALLVETSEAARALIPKGFRRGQLMEGDDPAVVEWWFYP